MTMRGFGLLSVGVHIAALLVGQFGLHRLFVERDVAAQIIPVEIVRVSAETVAPPVPEVAVSLPAPPPPPERQLAAVAPPPDVPVPPEPDPPAPPEPDIVAAPPEPVAEPQVVSEAPEPAVPAAAARARPRVKPTPPVRREFANVLKDLAMEDRPALPQLPLAQTLEPLLTEPVSAPTPSRLATVGEIDALAALVRRQIEPCWKPPIGAVEARDLIVRVLVRLDRGGFVREAQILDATRMALNPFYEAAADSARRAVLNDRCHPLSLPLERYELWKVIELTFNPSEMLG